jgi:hypothetical protein
LKKKGLTGIGAAVSGAGGQWFKSTRPDHFPGSLPFSELHEKF